MSETEYNRQQGFDKKELERQFWYDYVYSRTLNAKSINNEMVEIKGLGKVEKFNFLPVGIRKEAILFNGVYGKTTETKVICRSKDGKHGELMVDPTDIPNGYKIDSDGNCSQCFMGTVQRYKMEDYTDKMPSCSQYTLVEGYVRNNQGVVHFITLKLTGLGSKPFLEVQRMMSPGDELVVSVEGDDRSAKFNFSIAKKKELEPHGNLRAEFNKTFDAEFELSMSRLLELQQFRESVAPDFTQKFLGSDNSQLPAIGYDESEPEF